MRRILCLASLAAMACVDGESSSTQFVSSSSGELDAEATISHVASESSCLWEIDDILEEHELPVEDRENCGSMHYGNHEALVDGMACLQEATGANRPAQLTVNFCVDCSIPSTFIVTSDGDLFKVELEADSFGDELRTATLERCAAFTENDGSVPECTGELQLYRCQEPLR